MADPAPAPPPRKRRWDRILLSLTAYLLLESILPARVQPSAWTLIAALRAYQATLSPLLFAAGTRCKYRPSCSEYAVDAVARKGTLRGSWLAASRLLRCSPSGPGGLDPVDP